MSKSIKLKNNTYIDSSSISYNRNMLTTIIDNLRSLELLKIKVLSTLDPNTLTTGGIYQIARSLQTFTNVPTGANYGILIVIQASGGNGGAWQNTQIIFDTGGIALYRSRVNNKWGAWFKINTTQL